MTTEIEALKPSATKNIDLAQLEGQRVKIDFAELMTVRSKFAKSEDGESEVLKVTSVPLGTIQDRDGREVPLQASELSNLTRDEDGVFGRYRSYLGNANLIARYPTHGISAEAELRHILSPPSLPCGRYRHDPSRSAHLRRG